jgi:hypothetical protein
MIKGRWKRLVESLSVTHVQGLVGSSRVGKGNVSVAVGHTNDILNVFNFSSTASLSHNARF